MACSDYTHTPWKHAHLHALLRAPQAAWCEAYGHTRASSTNCLVLSSKKKDQLAACLVLAESKLDVNKKARQLMGVSRSNNPSFAPPELTTELTGMIPGGVTPFGLPDSIPLYIDAAVMDAGEPWTEGLPPLLWTGGGSRALKVGFPPALLLSLPTATVVEGLAIPQ